MEPSQTTTTTAPSPPLSTAAAAAADLGGGHARWTPTKEQIAVLEGLYRQGVRTPSAEQIQQITWRLRQHGHIEGKNVFYWFQNHKARQRQRQKQQSFAYFSRLLHRPPPLPRPSAFRDQIPLPTACGNVDPRSIYSPTCYLPAALQTAAGNVAYYQQPPSLVLPLSTCTSEATPNTGPCHNHATNLSPYDTAAAAGSGDRETLQLFPLQPTFALPKERHLVSASSTPLVSESSSPESEASKGENGGQKPPIFNFFAVRCGETSSYN